MLYLHVGMHKTGTTFLQQLVFPRLNGITYIQRENLDQFLLLDPDRNYLASNERLAGYLWATPTQVEITIARLAEMFPGARTLMSFRPHADWIVSAYKQFLDEGGTLTFEEYFDLEGDTGFVKREQLIYRRRIEALVKHFGHPPFVFFLREVERDLGRLLRDLEQFLCVTAPPDREILKQVRNRGMNYYPAQLLRWLNRWNRSKFNSGGRFQLENRFTVAFKIDPRHLCRYWLGFLPDRNFLSPLARQRIEQYYREDWEYVEVCGRERGVLLATTSGSTPAPL